MTALFLVMQLITASFGDVTLYPHEGETMVVIRSSNKQADYAIVQLFYKRMVPGIAAELTLSKAVTSFVVHGVDVMADPVPLDIGEIYQVKVTYLRKISENSVKRK